MTDATPSSKDVRIRLALAPERRQDLLELMAEFGVGSMSAAVEELIDRHQRGDPPRSAAEAPP